MQINSVKKIASIGAGAVTADDNHQETAAKDFSDYLKDALNNVNDLQTQSREATVQMMAGQVEDISDVAIASEKAGLAFQLTLQVRNKVLEAYQEIMRMQV